MLIMGHPQFETQDDMGIGDGIPPVPEWQLDSTARYDDLSELIGNDIDYTVENVFIRLRNVFLRAEHIPLPTTRLHDLTCFVVHRLLLSTSETSDSQSSATTECVRYAIILYMFTIQGPTYYSHAVILEMIVNRFVRHLQRLEVSLRVYERRDFWLLAIGMVASSGTANYQWFVERALTLAASSTLDNGDDVIADIRSVLWLNIPQFENVFRSHWDPIFSIVVPPESHGSNFGMTSSSTSGKLVCGTISPTDLVPTNPKSAQLER